MNGIFISLKNNKRYCTYVFLSVYVNVFDWISLKHPKRGLHQKTIIRIKLEPLIKNKIFDRQKLYLLVS